MADLGIRAVHAILTLRDKLTKLFADKQVLGFLRPMLANMDEYRKIRDQAINSQGVTGKYFTLAMTGLNAKVTAAAIGLNNLLSAGEGLLPILKDIMDTTTKVVTAVGDWANANLELASGLVKGVAALMALSVGSSLLRFAFAGLVLKGWQVVRFLVKLGGGKWGKAFMALGRGAVFLSKGLASLSGVTIERLPYSEFITRYDRKHTLYYLDPPYWGCENDYGRNVFGRVDFENLSTLLRGIKGRFIMSINDVPEIRDLFDWATIEAVETTYTVAKGKGKRVGELIITA